jgi:hypothetical protein
VTIYETVEYAGIYMGDLVVQLQSKKTKADNPDVCLHWLILGTEQLAESKDKNGYAATCHFDFI